jgi:hypothetical protein
LPIIFYGGARERFGLIVKENDPCWIQWKDTYNKFYLANQRNGIGKIVNEAGYKIMQDIDLTDKKILEIGAGDIRHLKYLRGKPKEYFACRYFNLNDGFG